MRTGRLLLAFKAAGGLAALALLLSGPHAGRLAAQAPADPAGAPRPKTAEQIDARLRALREGLDYVPGEVLVKFKEGAGPAQETRVLSLARGGSSAVTSRWIHDILHVSAQQEDNPERLAAILRQQPEVEWAQPNYIVRLKSVPNDSAYERQWNMTLLDMPRAWDISDGGASTVTVAVLDSGVTTQAFSLPYRVWVGNGFVNGVLPVAANPDIASSRVVSSLDFTGFISGPAFDGVGHGSHVAGTVLQETNNSIGLAGMAYRSRLLSIKVCISQWDIQFYLGSQNTTGFYPLVHGACFTDDVVDAIYYAANNGAQVINMSLGGPGVSPAYDAAIRYAVNRGVFVAIAAGNEYDEGNPTSYPAAYARNINGAMSVGAVTRTLEHAYYSNTGDWVEIAAPGGDTRRSDDDGIYQASLSFSDTDPRATLVPRFDRYFAVSEQGTSMATPHVAGLAALLMSRGVSNPAAVEAAIKAFAVDLGTAGPDQTFGYGLIDPPATLRGLGFIR